MSSTDKRIPVSEEIWKKLGDMKEAGQTYNQLLQKLIWKANRVDLEERMDEVKNMDTDELTPLDEIDV